jgi:hypothetical protein
LCCRENGDCVFLEMRVCCLQNEWVLYFVSVEREWRDCVFWRFVFVVCKNEWVVYFVSVEREWKLCFLEMCGYCL